MSDGRNVTCASGQTRLPRPLGESTTWVLTVHGLARESEEGNGRRRREKRDGKRKRAVVQAGATMASSRHLRPRSTYTTMQTGTAWREFPHTTRLLTRCTTLHYSSPTTTDEGRGSAWLSHDLNSSAGLGRRGPLWKLASEIRRRTGPMDGSHKVLLTSKTTQPAQPATDSLASRAYEFSSDAVPTHAPKFMEPAVVSRSLPPPILCPYHPAAPFPSLSHAGPTDMPAHPAHASSSFGGDDPRQSKKDA